MMKDKKTILSFLSSRKYSGRIKGVYIGIVLIFISLIGKFFYIQFVKQGDLKDILNKQYYYVETLKDKNYKLFDKNGEKFFKYSRNYYAVIDPAFYMRYNINKDEFNIKKAKYILRECNKNYIFPDEVEEYKYTGKIKYEIDKSCYDKLKSLKDIKGFYVYLYDKSNLKENWNIISVMDRANNLKDSSMKQEGTLERTMENIRKNNQVDKVVIGKNLTSEDTFNKDIKGNDNLNFRLTLDKEIQTSVEKIIRDEKYNSYKDIGVLLMESDTGKILAMANKDDRHPNINIGASSNSGYFPGSIFKVVTSAAALDNNIVWVDKMYKRNSNIKEHNNKKRMTLREGFIMSSNDVFYQVGEEVGFNNIYKYANKFNLTNPILGLQDEVSGKFEISNKIHRDEIKHAAIGQKIRITPLEALNIPNVIINKGQLVKPYIIDAIVDDNNKEIKNIQTKKEKVIKNSTAKLLENMMIDVVEDKEGTGTKAKVKGVKVGGKTGTSEYYEVNNGKRKKHSDGWFVGFFKLNEKKYSAVVLVRDIDWVKISQGGKEEDGGSTAAPIFSQIITNLKENSMLK
ncbi:penicillin-binding transpeptidase domain-containing protein [Hathewaya limosa]|uniref:Cell division protein FtsI/penicillin-binding protein 2 n=1 Tax=Hathewaya limosa TaxID=1536 RepID=A0ABU0JR96_HATLI|nr:penicillin-binding transpeptidase domain-containing protein [Hathewaya limosa]MDQ0478960.1 cell division protein FtsI/penicillin-binding protein 2 [Hathewaya limosa]